MPGHPSYRGSPVEAGEAPACDPTDDEPEHTPEQATELAADYQAWLAERNKARAPSTELLEAVRDFMGTSQRMRALALVPPYYNCKEKVMMEWEESFAALDRLMEVKG